MAIQGTQVPMYTKHTLYLYFYDFSIFLYEKKKKKNLKKKKNDNNINNNMLSKTTKLDWLKRRTTHWSYAKQKQEEREEVIESLGAIFLPHLGRTFSLSKPLNLWWGERIETVQVQKEHEGFKKISKKSNRGLKLILSSRCCHAVALLSG